MTERLRADVAIIGGGTAGCAAALALQKRGLTAVVLEKGFCGAGASGVNFGGVRRQGRSFAELPLATRSRAIWDRLPELVGEDGEFQVSGHVKLARSEADMAYLETYARDAAAYGLDLKLIGPNAVRADYPWLGSKVVGASLCVDDGQANPRLVGPAFARAARRAGADIRELTRVEAAASDGENFEVRAAGGLTVESRWLVNVAGAWAGKVAAWFGDDAPVATLAPNMIVTEPLPYFINRSIGVCGGDIYVRQVDRGNVVFGGGAGWGDIELERSRPVTATTEASMAKLIDLIPALRGAMVIRSWSGLDGEMPDHIPVIGPSPHHPRLLHAFGFSGHGFQLGPAVGEVLSELIVDGETPTDIGAFTIERFR
ncbi:FAD-binding oxidoreductase [Aliidongia dinghuensis]|uniref:FAD-binding oxidoreductase n=1 Tax=Aliidongia dinghuensis TaxID=1867774 RepID=A0A8J2YVC4_9PROT|nr:FAD-binding oxidoreductase [Aliidongia dinghuensis]GGF26712.1 FAD-binding oxidoreductase [Aliidongia dinghuensis]